jgi:superfamily I DNA and/or RNA helicase
LFIVLGLFRRRLFLSWAAKLKTKATHALRENAAEFEAAIQAKQRAEARVDLKLLKDKKVFGLTTTGAARLNYLINIVRPKVVIVEEAAEVLEGHILSALTNDVQHLLLVGDHKQLQPSTADYLLSKDYKLSISLFERLMEQSKCLSIVCCYLLTSFFPFCGAFFSDMDYKMLKTQRRMAPEISTLSSFHYKDEVKDGPNVQKYPTTVSGLGCRMFLFNHSVPEEQQHEGHVKLNDFEAWMVIRLADYLIKQGSIAPKEITILTAYSGQLNRVKRYIRSNYVYSRVNVCFFGVSLFSSFCSIGSFVTGMRYSCCGQISR